MSTGKKGYYLDKYLLAKALRPRKEIANSKKEKVNIKQKIPLPSYATEGTANLGKTLIVGC